MTKKQIALVVFWIVYVVCVGPFLISHVSYELPLLGLAIAIAGGYITYRITRKPQ